MGLPLRSSIISFLASEEHFDVQTPQPWQDSQLISALPSTILAAPNEQTSAQRLHPLHF